MPRPSPHDETDALASRYAEMGDAELLALRADFDNLTEMAQDALRRELQTRKLWSTAPGETHAELEPEPESEAEPNGEPDLQLGGESICECESTEQGELVQYALGLQKITATIYRPQGRFYALLPQIRVAPDDVERAQAILAQGVPDAVVKEFEARPAPEDFVEPACPKCGSDDVLLEAVDPTNEWLCEACGAHWQDKLEAP
jgi:hypothetical protein